MMAKTQETIIDAGGRELRVSNPDRVIFPATGRTGEITKLDVVEYYLAVADGIMRALRAVWNSAAKADTSLPANPVKQLSAWYPEPRRKGVVRSIELAVFYQAVMAEMA